MANPYLYATLPNSMKRVADRGGVMSGIHDGHYYISCAKHPEIHQPAVKVSMDKDVLTELEKAFDNCPGCVEEHTASQWANTRFPEGAEI